ncbi:MAG: radical SAM protein [Candidatus Brocadiia bacterium]|jgi:magnesium-protoporphyrin IX monomethyl ester (oxidative) cyclase
MLTPKTARAFKHVLCVYPYHCDQRGVGFVPPLGLEYIAAVIEPFAQSLDLVDLRHESGHTEDFLRPETELVCFSINWDCDAAFMRNEICSVPPRILTVLGGRHASEDPERWLTLCPNAAVVVRGDGEEIVEELCRGVPLEKITGISFRKDGRIVHNAARKLGPIRDDIMPLRRRRRQPYPVLLEGLNFGVEVELISGSRGCPFNCAFCSFSRNPWGEKRPWSGRSPESVVEELAAIAAPLVIFVDDLFTCDMDRVERICDLILERGIRRKYVINARLEIARRPDVLRKMERAGFIGLLVGIESAQDKTLHSMRKGFDTAKIREYCAVLKDYRMSLLGYFILGNIGETKQEMLQIGPFARELGLDAVIFSILQARPYSGLDELVAANPSYHIAKDGKVFSDELSVKELRQLRGRINREFYSAGQVLKILRKGVRYGGLALLPGLLLRLPLLLLRLGMRPWRRARRRAAESYDITVK